MPRRLSRRQLFRVSPLRALAEVARGGSPQEVATPVRPPGALPTEQAFVETCAGCPHCSTACPFDVISHLGPEAGEAEGTPVLTPVDSPCRWCVDMPCVTACPTGALAAAPSPPDAIGTAVIDEDRCLASQGILCEDCVDQCPPGVSAIKLRRREPRVDEAACVGCGLCAFYCAATPSAIRIEVLRSRPG